MQKFKKKMGIRFAESTMYYVAINVSWYLERRRLRNPWTCMHELSGSEDSYSFYNDYLSLHDFIHMSK